MTCRRRRAPARRRDRAGRRHAARATTVDETWAEHGGRRVGRPRDRAVRSLAGDQQIAGEVRDFDASHVLDRKEIRRNDRYTQFALVAAREAMDQAGLPERLEGEEAEATGVIIGSGLGGSSTLFDSVADRAPARARPLSPFFIPMAIANIGAGQIAINFGALGPQLRDRRACATAGHAIGEAIGDRSSAATPT